jgi:2-aminoadipate transaminase
MRLGYAIGQKDILRQMVVTKQYVDCATNTLSQYILLEFIKTGMLDKRIESNIEFYKKKRDHMLVQLKKHFPTQVKWNHPSGGFFIFVHLPEYIDASALLVEAVKHDVAFVAGQPFFADGSGANTFRLSFSQASLDDIDSAVERLGLLINEKLIK